MSLTESRVGEHPAFRGGFTPVTEEITAFDLPVTGRIPAELNGRYLRNGPNPMNLDDPRLHLFAGDGMVHGVRLRDGRAEWYRNRWVRSARVAERLGVGPERLRALNPRLIYCGISGFGNDGPWRDDQEFRG